MSTPFANRLKKRARHLGKWAKRWPTQAYRVYDRDIPEYAWTVDVYGQDVYVQHFAQTPDEKHPQHDDVLEAIEQVLEPRSIALSQRLRQKGSAQYEKLDDRGRLSVVEEDGLRFQVNLYDYIDTGLFLDHRAMRRMVGADVKARAEGGRPLDVLNLFAYTCSFSVYAARHGARTHSVDLSNTYLEWGKRNFELNGMSVDDHAFERSDLLRWLPQATRRKRRYDVIVLDPPTFSRSKSMERDMDVQRDHVALIEACITLLKPGGALYFSTNFQRFRLDEGFADASCGAIWEEITARTISEDFRTPIHRAWRATRTP